MEKNEQNTPFGPKNTRHKMIKHGRESVKITYDQIHAGCKYYIGCPPKDCNMNHCTRFSKRIAKILQNAGFTA